MSFLLLFMSSLHQNWRRGQNRFCLEAKGSKKGEGVEKEREREGEQGQGGEIAQTMYAHINK
jgi:hypothetical protein